MIQKDIIQELNDLGSSLSNSERINPYTVPAGYFENFAESMLSNLKNQEEEKQPAWTKANGYHVPDGYFSGFADNMLQKIKAHADNQTSQQEIEELSPLLNSLKNRPVFSVPEHYFETLNPAIPTQETKPAKVVSITGKKWFRIAAAAVVVSIISFIGFKMINQQQSVDAIKEPYAWVKKNMKNVDTTTVDNFVALAKETVPAETESTVTAKADVKELVKDIPENEINKFLDETSSNEETDDVETLLN